MYKSVVVTSFPLLTLTQTKEAIWESVRVGGKLPYFPSFGLVTSVCLRSCNALRLANTFIICFFRRWVLYS